MPAETRLAAVLFGSFLLAFPALGAFLRGDLDAGAVGMRFAVAAALAWGAIALVTTIVSGYRTETVPAEAAADVAADRLRRRAEDQATAEEDAPGAGVDAGAVGSVISDASGG